MLRRLATTPRPKPPEGDSVYPPTFSLQRYIACDTEVAHIDVAKQSPVRPLAPRTALLLCALAGTSSRARRGHERLSRAATPPRLDECRWGTAW